jgi:ubiquinone/menaquinone biosynthesis C-methylase UbiE
MPVTRYVLIAMLLPWISWGQNPWKDVYTENAWAERDTWQKPDAIIALLGLTNQSSVADIGSHEGYFTMKLAAAVPEGQVYSVDISERKLEKLKEISARRGFGNVRAILAAPDDPKLPSHAVDAVLIVDTYHEIKDHEAFLANLKRELKPGATIVICEPIADERKGKSRETQFRKHELESRYVLADLRKAGFTVLRHEEKFIDRTVQKGDTMWIIVAKPKH